MTFEEVMPDVRRMIGLPLRSIRKGAEVRLEEIDPREGRLRIRAKARLVTRRLDEMKRIWEALRHEPAVHVDSLLGGSGSSRNQPETLLANLPYVEWLRIDGRKHLAFVGRPTHDLGTLKEMDPLRAEELRLRMRARIESRKGQLILVTQQPADVTRALRAVAGQEPETLAGEYRVSFGKSFVSIIQADALKPGLYPVIEASVELSQLPPVRAAGQDFRMMALAEGTILVRHVAS